MTDRRTPFKKIIDGDIPAQIVFQDEHCLAFHDISPQAPVHVLIIPREEIPSLADLHEHHRELAGHLLLVIAQIARELRLDQGYRVVTNIGVDGGQSVPHLHFHLLGGRSLRWPPG